MENIEQNEVTETKSSPLQTITPFSKYLAMTLFIILPFLGGWIGYTYAPEKVVEVERVVVEEVENEVNVWADPNDAQPIKNVYWNFASKVVEGAFLFDELEINNLYGDFTLKSISNISGTDRKVAEFEGTSELVGVFVSDASILPPSFVPTIASTKKLPIVVGEKIIDDFRLEFSVAPDFCIVDNVKYRDGAISIASSFFDNETAYYLGFDETERTVNTFQKLSNPVKVSIKNLTITSPQNGGSGGCYVADIVSYEIL